MDFVGTVEKGRLKLDLPASFDRWLMTLEGKKIIVSVRRFSKDRTPPQLRYYWAVPVRLISQHTGYEEGEVHAILKQMFLKTVNADGYEYVKSLSAIARQVDTTEMNELKEKIQRWAATKLGLYIPDPNEEKKT
jgi:hypothetical protein